ncbi:MAG: regulator of protease activity HflC (stomatin/prohibitin superfamily) [Sulfurimonas sp.]|jgi:regulator of protease activity HflC (stomatin/prohibitin superfamily)|uniref:SPFH domain-containing protein n=1 Tax=Sulfurimonas sp. TaxID=2022749 RepID=UPI0039E45089
MEGLIFTGAIILFALAIIVKGIKIVSQADMLVVERLGKFHTVLKGGLNFIIPIVDNPVNQLTTKEQMIDIPKQSVITKDNVNITIDGIVFCTVENAQEATYNVVDFKKAISNLAMTTLRSEIGSMELDATLSNRDTLNAKLQNALGEASLNWGVKITRVEISDISVPKEIEVAMNLQMQAEREKRAKETTAEADKVAQVLGAEGFKQEEILKAEAIERMADAKKYEQIAVATGQSEAMDTINKAMKDNKEASEFLLAKDRIKAFEKLANSDSSNKVILPYNVTEMIGSMSIMGDALFKGLENGKPNS